MRLIRTFTSLLAIFLTSVPNLQAVNLAAANLGEGVKADFVLQIQSQISQDIRREFSKLQKELIAQIKTELKDEIAGVKDEVAIKLENNEANMKTLGNNIQSASLKIEDFDIRLRAIQSSINDNLATTNKNLVDNFDQMKRSVTEDMSGFKIELQQSKSHLENFKSSTESSLQSTLNEHTNQIYSTLDKLKTEMTNKVNAMQVTIATRIGTYHQDAKNSFDSRELTISRKLKDQFNEMTGELKISMQKHQDQVGDVFGQKIQDQGKVLKETEDVLLVKLNTTMIDHMEKLKEHLKNNAVTVSKSLRDSEANVNQTLLAQVDEISKYIQPSLSSFTDTLVSEFSNMNFTITNKFNENEDKVDSISKAVEDMIFESGKTMKDFNDNKNDIATRFKSLENNIDTNVVKLNKTINLDFYTHKSAMIAELNSLRTTLLETANSNQQQTKEMFDKSILTRINSALDEMTQTFGDIESKLSNIEDEKEDLLPTITEALQNVVNSGVDDMKTALTFSVSTPLKGKLDTIQTMVEALGASGGVNKAKEGSR